MLPQRLGLVCAASFAAGSPVRAHEPVTRAVADDVPAAVPEPESGPPTTTPTPTVPRWPWPGEPALAPGSPPMATPEDPPPLAGAPTPVRLVLAGSFALYMTPGIAPYVPFPEADLFVGVSLPRPRPRPGRWTAIGVDVGVLLSPFAHVHLGVYGLAAPGGRLMYAAGLGPVFFLENATRPVSIEGEARLGWVLTRRPGNRVQGVLGALVRVFDSSNNSFGATPARAQVGLFVGFVRVPVAPGQPPARASAPTRPRTGVGMLVVGGVMGAAVLALAITDITIAARSSEGCHGCLPVSVFMPIPLAIGVPLVVVGEGRMRRHRAAQRRVTLGPGRLALSF